MNEPQFVLGLFPRAPQERAPSFVKMTLSIKREVLLEWLAGRGDEWINVDVKESKAGTLYCAVNTYKREQSAPVKDSVKPQSKPDEEKLDNDIPF